MTIENHGKGNYPIAQLPYFFGWRNSQLSQWRVKTHVNSYCPKISLGLHWIQPLYKKIENYGDLYGFMRIRGLTRKNLGV